MQKIKAFFKKNPHAWWGLFTPIYLIMFFTIEHFITDHYWATQTAIDGHIPFLEGFIVFYVIWCPMLVVTGVYLIFKDPEGFRRYMWSLMLSFTTATVICAIVPNGQDLRPAVMERHNAFTWLVEYTYSIDTNTNVFPSVHVLGVMAALAAVWHTPGLRKWPWRLGAGILGALIIAATLFVKQHAAIDVAAGLALSAVTYVIIYGIVGRRRDRKLKDGREPT